MREFKHKKSGEVMKVQDNAKVLPLLTTSPSWEEVKPKSEKKPEAKKEG